MLTDALSRWMNKEADACISVVVKCILFVHHRVSRTSQRDMWICIIFLWMAVYVVNHFRKCHKRSMRCDFISCCCREWEREREREQHCRDCSLEHLALMSHASLVVLWAICTVHEEQLSSLQPLRVRFDTTTKHYAKSWILQSVNNRNEIKYHAKIPANAF